MNNNCNQCDNSIHCSKKIRIDNNLVLIKEQNEVEATCICKLQEVCKDCLKFRENKCAYWTIFNGKKVPGSLIACGKVVK